MKTGLQYTLRRESREQNDETRTMQCSLVRPDGTIAGTYRLTAEEDDWWSVETLTGTFWDDATDMATDRTRTIEHSWDDEELDACYEKGEIEINILLPISLAGLDDAELAAVYDCHEAERDNRAECARAVVAACWKLIRNNGNKRYTLEEAVRLVGILFYAAAEEDNVISYDFIPAYDDEDAVSVRHYPARHQVEVVGKDTDDLFQAVTILTDLESDDCDSDEDVTWAFFNA